MASVLGSDESLAAGVKRIATEEIAGAIEDISDPARDVHEVVHEFRKRCKKIRGLLRLVRPAFGDFDAENGWYRDRSRVLSTLRDATSMQECLAALTGRYARELGDDPFPATRAWLEHRKRDVTADEEARTRLRRIAGELPAAMERVAGWDLASLDAAAMAAGMTRTYKRARHAMARSAAEPTDAQFHEWRKRVKYYWHQTGFIAPAWPPVFSALHDETKRLSDLLGDDHDLAVFRETLAAERDAADAAPALLALIETRSEELRTAAMALGRRLFAEEPAEHAGHIEGILAAFADEIPGARGGEDCAG